MPKFSFSKPYYNVAGAANTVATEEAYNVYFEVLPQGGYAIRRRPGISKARLNPDPTTSGGGVYWSDRNGKLYASMGGKLYTQLGFNSGLTYIGDAGYAELPTIFAEGQLIDLSSIVYVANGGKLQYVDSTNTLIDPTDANTPDSTFITMMNNRFIANDIVRNQDFLITDVNPGSGLMDVTYWSSAVNPFRTAQKPDALVGVYSGWNEIYLWGQTACEVWQEDGVTPVSPLVGSLIEVGLAAPYSVVMANNTMYALCTLAGKRSIVTLSGRAPQVISEPIANVIQSYTTVADAIGSMCYVGGLNIYLLSFPTEGVTWAYDIKNDLWSQWSTWDLVNAHHNVFMGQFGTYAKTWNKHITQGTDGSLYEFSRENYSDDGNPIRSSVRTGWIDHGTWDRKRSDQLIIKLQGYAHTDSTILLRHRSDGFPEWSTTIEIKIAANQQNDHFCKLNRMGMYRSRQYEFIMTDANDLALIGFDEDVTRMRN